MTQLTHVEITSCFTNQTWEGNVPLNGVSHWEKLQSAFRMFNRVTDEDARRLESLEFDQPSMSRGDRVVLDGTAYKCDSIGFTRDTRDPHEPLNPWPQS